MSSLLTASLSPLNPLLPLELEFKIFQTCFFEYPQSLSTLLLVSKRVFKWIQSIRYYSMQLTTQEDVDRIRTWVQSQSPQSVHQNVKAILVHHPCHKLYPSIQEIVSRCTGVQHLGLWFYPQYPGDASPECLISTALTCLRHVRHLSLSPTSEEYIFRFLFSPKEAEEETASIAFRDTLEYIDWGGLPKLPLDTFPNVAFEMILLRKCWPLQADVMHRMDEWLSRPNSKGLMLIGHIYLDLKNPGFRLEEGHILHRKEVVLLNSPDNWGKDWEKLISGDGDDAFSIGKSLVGQSRLQDRVAMYMDEDDWGL